MDADSHKSGSVMAGAWVSLDNLGKLPVKFLSFIASPSRYFREETKHDTRLKQDHANHLLMKLATGT